MKRFLSNKVLLIIIGILILNSCKKPVEGFLSENVFYQISPFVAEQGITAYSAALQVDGSTAPISVSLIGARNAETGEDVLDSLIKPRSIPIFTGTILPTDTLLADLTKNISTDLKPALNINKIGGRIELSAATKYLPSGAYDIDIQVTNSSGTKIFKNACQIIFNAAENPYANVYKRLRVYTRADPAVVEGEPTSEMGIDVRYTASATTQVILKFVDKNGVAFNPLTGDIKRWSSTFPTLKEWNPYYPEEVTSTGYTYTLPNIGIQFPYVSVVYLPGGGTWTDTGGANTYIRLDENSNVEGKRAQITSSWQFKASGTYEITYRLNGFTKK
ncbi:hypothetical protein ACSBL2_01995 [Pedobacter sp. AW31-3R]|uniref:hypothetical protein n=1 Tax=Pedobacter sp. AW31-3R TaxID=3445781 RepID=UPI003F9F2921